MSDDPTRPPVPQVEAERVLAALPSKPEVLVAALLERDLSYVNAVVDGCLSDLSPLFDPSACGRLTEIDKRVRGLVDALDRLPGVATFSSCGGHEERQTSRVRYPEWYVNFEIEPTPEAHDSLTRIVAATQEHEPLASVDAWWKGDYLDRNGRLYFKLSGECEPDDFVETLAVLRT